MSVLRKVSYFSRDSAYQIEFVGKFIKLGRGPECLSLAGDTLCASDFMLGKKTVRRTRFSETHIVRPIRAIAFGFAFKFFRGHVPRSAAEAAQG